LLQYNTWNIIRTDECDSTNNTIKELMKEQDLADRTALMTNLQLKGRGQGTNTWYSSKYKNLLCSLYCIANKPATDNFLITIVTSISIHRMLANHGIKSKIKWPNDIYYEDKKIAGVLIENSLIRNTIVDTIIGVGLNVNETEFPDELPNPASMKQICEKEFNMEQIFNNLVGIFDEVYAKFMHEGGEMLYHEYISSLYRLNQWHLYKLNGTTINGRVHGVEPDGRLLFETDGGRLMHLFHGEVEYVI
jgi:BirA family biotin operon repressor/biotin-[acetyl-CoA-carboxylase] ligase